MAKYWKINPGLFLFIFVLFAFQLKWQVYNLNDINWKKHRWCAWDLNPGQQDWRRRRIHWAMAAPLFDSKIYQILYIAYYKKIVRLWTLFHNKRLSYVDLYLLVNLSYFDFCLKVNRLFLVGSKICPILIFFKVKMVRFWLLFKSK